MDELSKSEERAEAWIGLQVEERRHLIRKSDKRIQAKKEMQNQIDAGIKVEQNTHKETAGNAKWVLSSHPTCGRIHARVHV